MTTASISPAKTVLLALALGLAVALGASTAQARPATPATTKCPTLTSMHWSVKKPGGTISGTRYTVVTEQFSCSLASRLIPALIKQNGTPAGRSLKGPAGYACLSFAGANNPNAIAGACHRPHGQGFGWGPALHS